MDLFLVPNNVENATFVSPLGDPFYTISTNKLPGNGARTSQLQRVLASSTRVETISDLVQEEGIDWVLLVAEVDWKTWMAPTVIRSPALGGMARSLGFGIGMQAKEFLFKQKRFSSSRYFRDGNETYCWKYNKDCFMLIHKSTKTEIARYTVAPVTEGVFMGEKKLRLTIQPTSFEVNVDLIVLSFIIMEKKRRARGGDGTKLTAHDEDPQGDGCAEGGE